jgi:glycosyltransferase involved in cell wall biosynthesis
MICRDNEDTIRTALDSAKGVFDEIVVVDTGSIDNTIKIVNEYTNKIYEFDWRDDFALARNISIDHATSDFIFWMDADDELSEEARTAIKIISADNKKDVAYFFKIHNVITDEIAKTWINDYNHLKLFPRRDDIRFRNDSFGKMHESVEQDVYALPIEVRSLFCSVIHHGYETTELLERKIFLFFLC